MTTVATRMPERSRSRRRQRRAPSDLHLWREKLDGGRRLFLQRTVEEGQPAALVRIVCPSWTVEAVTIGPCPDAANFCSRSQPLSP